MPDEKPKIVEPGEVILGHIPAASDSAEIADATYTAGNTSSACTSRNGPLGKDSTLNQVLEDYVRGVSDYISSQIRKDGTYRIVAEKFDPEPAIHYCSFMIFDKGLKIRMKDLGIDEYIGVLKKTSPDLGELIEKTDLKTLLPDKIMFEIEDQFNKVPALGLESEQGRTAMMCLIKTSESLKIIPDLYALSLFMKAGSQFREYVDITSPEQDFPLFVIEKQVTGWDNNNKPRSYTAKVCSKFPKAEYIFNPCKLSDYIAKTGNTDIKDMMQQYTVLADACNTITVGNVDSSIRVLYDMLSAANPNICDMG